LGHDPFITPSGIQDAFCTGEKFQEYKTQLEHVLFGGEAFDEVRIESSPYLRTMQTASHFMRGFNQTNYITVNHLYGEALEHGEDA